MKKLGIIGGISWVSTAMYYEQINLGIKKRCGGHESADLLIRSFNFAEVEKRQRSGDWAALNNMFVASGEALINAGAEGLLIAANTMHKVAPALSHLPAKLIHIADAIAMEAKEKGIETLGLLGTRFVMGEDFLKHDLQKHGLDISVPTAEEQKDIDAIIFDELVHRKCSKTSSERGLEIIKNLENRGCNGVALACTEFGVTSWQEESSIPAIDSEKAHVNAALHWILG